MVARTLTRVTALLACGVAFNASAQFSPDALTVSPESMEVSPKATRPLAPQPKDRGQLIQLHSGSVLEWLCRDTQVEGPVFESVQTCYTTVWPVVATCEERLQDRAPAAQNRQVGNRLGVVEFRSELRKCFVTSLAEQRQAANEAPLAIPAESVDPLAARMRGGKFSQ